MNDQSLTDQTSTESSHDSSRWLWIKTSLAIVLAASCIRLLLNFRYSVTPGMDAAYYPMQTRWLIEHGELLDQQPPLIFWFNYALTNLIQFLLGTELDDACMLASRLIDCVSHPWAAVPIMLLGYRWASGRREALLGCASAAVLAVMSPPVLRMASDFQKNSLGLVWMAFALLAIREALSSKSIWRWGTVALFFFLAGLTHMGAFGVTCVMLSACLIGFCMVAPSARVTPKRIAILTCLLGSVAVLLGLMYLIQPTWTQRLFNLPSRALGLVDFRMSLGPVVFSLAVYGVLALLLRWLWRQRRELQPCDVAVVIGCSAGLAVLVLPIFQGTWAMRFQLMTPLPGAFLLAFAMCRLSLSEKTQWLPRRLAVVPLVLALAAPFFMQGPVMTMAAVEELRGLRNEIENPAKTLVVAPHGVEFWAGTIMHTRVQSGAVPKDVQAYEEVLILEPKQALASQRRQQPERRGPPGPPRRDHRGGPPPRGDKLTVPPNAKVIRNGNYFTVYKVPVQ